MFQQVGGNFRDGQNFPVKDLVMGAVAATGTDVTGAQGDVDEVEKSVGAVFDDAMGGREDVLVAD